MAQIEELRRWQRSAIESHMYSTAELVGDKILAMSGHPEDAYWLAQTYYGMGEFLRGADMIARHAFEQESPKCKYIAALCLLQAQELDRALALLTSPSGPASSVGAATNDSSTSQIMVVPDPISAPGSRATSGNYNGSGAFAGSGVLGNGVFGNGGLGSGGLGSGVHGGSGNIGGTGAAHTGSGMHTGGAGGNVLNNRIRVLSTSSLKNPEGRGSRTVSTGSRVSMILPELEEDSATHISPFKHDDQELNGVLIDSLLQFLLGRVYTLQSKFNLAKDAYIAALRIDARCFDAFSQLLKHHALTPKDEWALLASLDFSRIEADLGRSLYALRLSVLTHNEDLADAVDNLVETYQIPMDNGDITAARGNVAYARGQYTTAKDYYEVVLSQDPQNLSVYTNYVTSLLELGETNEIYRIAHELGASAPNAIETWYCIGAYYLAIGRVPEARRYFSKASLIDPGYSEAWLAFARTFVEESEHEQAITAFSTVARLFPGYHLPYVHIGIQHLQLLNLGLAEKYLATAADLFDEDPLLLNELGVVFYHKHELQRASRILEMALQISQKTGNDINTQISIKSNLAYVMRRMNRFSEALEMFEDVCRHAPLNSNILAAMGLCLLQMNDSERATEKLALALAITRDDPVANDLMKRAVQVASESFDINDFTENNAKYMRRPRVELDFAV